jgi:hypothetical protein
MFIRWAVPERGRAMPGHGKSFSDFQGLMKLSGGSE